jgi:outer membrane receptor protein involved in Fe transport
MRRIPPLFGRVGLQYIRPRFQCTLEGLFADRQDRLAAGDISDNRIPAGGTPGWVVFNVYGEYVLKKLSLRMGFWNLSNEDYRYHGSGINAPGRTATLGVEYVF